MEKQLADRTYQTGRYICFAVSEPKIREVWAADFRDRVLHHLLINRLEPVWEPKFIHRSFACRKNKGAHKAIKNLKKISSLEGHQRFDLHYGGQTSNKHNRDRTSSEQTSNKFGNLHYLQIDVESFFMNIDKDILMRLIEKHIKNPEILWLARLIIFQNPIDNFLIKGDRKLLKAVPENKSLFHNPPGKGLPIGNYTSQFFANLYLNEIDQFIKHQLKCRHYFRYMDDLLLLHPDKNQLKNWKKQISDFLWINLGLKLHPKKQIIRPTDQGIDFLGYVVKPNYSLCRKRIVANLKKKLHYFNKLINPEIVPLPENKTSHQLSLFPARKTALSENNLALLVSKAQAVVNSYYGHFQYANCKKLRKKIYFCHFKELKNFLEPADKNFSYFKLSQLIRRVRGGSTSIMEIEPPVKQEITRNGTHRETCCHC